MSRVVEAGEAPAEMRQTGPVQAEAKGGGQQGKEKNPGKSGAAQETVKPGKITARVIDEKYGYQELKRVRAIRINSDRYMLLIMEDYVPTLGMVHGDVTFLCDDREEKLETIDAFYKAQHNEFTLLITEDWDGVNDRL